LEKLHEDSSARGPQEDQGTDTDRSPSTSVGSSQNSFPTGARTGAGGIGNEVALPSQPQEPCLEEAAWVNQLCEEKSLLQGGLSPAKQSMTGAPPDSSRLAVDLPPVAQTFDDFMSPRRSDGLAQPVKPTPLSPAQSPALVTTQLTPTRATLPMPTTLPPPAPSTVLWPRTEANVPQPVGKVGQTEFAMEMAMAPVPELVAPEPVMLPGSTPYACAYVPSQAPMHWTGNNGELPSLGSANHGIGQCKPCAFHHTKGCQRGAGCTFCHLCLPGEKKRRQKEKQAVARAKTAFGR